VSHLSGKLKTFSLRQILVLLADADTTGELQVASPTLSGRIFFESGVVAYGTTRAGEDSLSELDRLLESYDDDSPARARPVIKEQLTEVLHGLMQAKSGTFDFDEGTPGGTRSFDVGVTFTVTDLLTEVDNRIEEWRKIREVIPSTSTPLGLASDLPAARPEVTLDASAWTMLSTVGGGASIVDVATKLEVSEFKAAEKLTELVNQGLLAVAGEVETSPHIDSDPADSAIEPAEQPLELKKELRSIRRPELHEKPSTPRVDPKVGPVAFSRKDLSREERNELIRNIGKGIYPSD
jgi:hypothetical protein